MEAIPFIDAHVHLWDLKRLRYAWLTPPFGEEGPNGSVEAIARTYLPPDYAVDAARWNVVGTVHVDAGAHPEDALAETEWLEGLGEAHGMPTAIVAYAALEARNVDEQLAAQAVHPRVRGIRQIVNWHPDPRRTYSPRDLTIDPEWKRGFARLADHGLSFDLQCYPGQMPAMAELCARHPGVRVIVNHMGMPVLSEPDGLARWREGLRHLAELPQVAIKLSGFGFVDRAWTGDSITPLLHEAIALFGTDRCMFASDFPTDALWASYDRVLDTCWTAAQSFAEEERHDLFHRSARRWYRLD